MKQLTGEAKDLSIESIGVPVSSLVNQELKSTIHYLLGGAFQREHFPGMQPVSLESKHLQDLVNVDYHVCEKSDGIRILGLMQFKGFDNGLPIGSFYITDRKYEFREVEMVFPHRLEPELSFHRLTLIDGELILDKENEEKILRLYIFDLLALESQNYTNLNLNERFNAILKSIWRPFEKFYSKYPELAKMFPFKVSMKEMFKPYYIRYIFEQVIPKLKHENDGLIFTPVYQGYKVGTCHSLLKWKPKDMNTVDFKLDIYWDSTRKPHFRLLIARNLVHEPIGWLTVEPELREEWLKSLPMGRIIECRYDSEWRCVVGIDQSPHEEIGGFRFVRFRDDKLTANDVTVYRRIMHAIEDGVSAEQVGSF